MTYYQDKDLTIRPMLPSDCQAFYESFAAHDWHKPLAQFQRYFQEQEQGVKRILVAAWQGEVAGYTTLLPQAPAGPFAGKGWPEVQDFNVLPPFQRRGIGSRILEAAEDLASQTSDTICLGVGLHSGYGTAQRLYVKRGYVFDGSGLWYRDKPLEQYAPCAADDGLVLYLSKKLVRREFRPLTQEELVPELFRCFDRFQIVEKCWRKVEGQWVVKDVVFTERWGEKDYRFLCQCLRNTMATGGQVWGAFLEGRLKGFASVEGPLVGSRKQYADLTSIHVSADARATAWGGGCSCWRRTPPASWGPRPCTSPPTRRWRARPSTRPWAAWRQQSISPPTWSRSPATASWSAPFKYLLGKSRLRAAFSFARARCKKNERNTS